MQLSYEPKKIYDVTKSQEAFKRALKVVPAGIYGHLGPSEGCMIPVSSYPLFMSKAKGAYFWDVDGNKFIDYMCAYGPNFLGYNDPDVDAAALEQLKKGNCVTLASELLIEFAEEMVNTINMADWAFFAKNGGDATSFAVMIARAYTNRKKVVLVSGYYHGVAPWMQKLGYAGITEEDIANNLYIDWNAPDQFEKLIKKYPGQIAALIATPYYHPTFVDNQLPPEGYWQKMRKLCDDNGIILIFEMTGNITNLLPLILCSIIAYLVADLLRCKPIYESLLERYEIKEGTEAYEVKTITLCVEYGSKAIGKAIKDIKWPKGAQIVKVERHGKEIIASGDLILVSSDMLDINVDIALEAKIREELDSILR